MKKIIYAKWRDSNVWHGQVDKRKFDVAIMHTVGFVVEDNEDRLVLAQECFGDEYRNVISIPKENILNLKDGVEASDETTT